MLLTTPGAMGDSSALWITKGTEESERGGREKERDIKRMKE